MTVQLPTVRERPRRLEPVTPDPFLEAPDPPRPETGDDPRAAAPGRRAVPVEEE